MSAGVSGALAARGRRPRRRRHDARRQPDRVGAHAARLLADGRRRAALQHPAPPARPRAPGRRREPEAVRRRGAAAGRAAGRRADADDGGVRGDPRRGPPAGDAGRGRRRSTPRTRRWSSSPRGRPASRAGAVHAAALSDRPARARPSTGSARSADELVWCTTATGWSKSARNVFVAPWLCGAAALICDARFDPAERLGADRARGRQRALPGADRVPDAREAHASCGRSPALRRLVSAGEALDAEVIEAFRERGRARDPRRLRTDRDRAPDRATTSASEVRPGSMGKPLPGVRAADRGR